SIDVDRSMPAVVVRWDVLLAALDLVLVGVQQAGPGGAVRVAFEEVPIPGSLRVSVVRAAATGTETDTGTRTHGQSGPGPSEPTAASRARLLDVAAGLLERHGGGLSWERSLEEDRTVLAVPIDDRPSGV